VVSGLKSDSTKGGGGYNEISMDDTKGKEKVTVHAQYDMNTTVEHAQTNTVNNTFTETIKSDTTVKITEGRYSHDVVANTAVYHVQGALTENYDTSQETTVKGKVIIKSTAGVIEIWSDKG
jgi:type VI secretion system secreted protein VgrG